VLTRRPAKHCHICGRRLWGKAWGYALSDKPDEQALVVCRDCHQNAPRCDICNLPMGERHTSLPDGRRICARCSQTAVYDSGQAQTIFERVVGVVTDRLGLKLNVGTDFALVDPEHLRRLAVESGRETKRFPADPSNVVGLFIRKGRKRVMYVLSGLPRMAFIHTVAHEWAHAWQGENCPLLNDPLVREGFAEWAAHKTLQVMGQPMDMIMSGRDDVYGEGLRKMLHVEQGQGISGVLEACRRSA
jgi:hypothetical protein